MQDVDLLVRSRTWTLQAGPFEAWGMLRTNYAERVVQEIS